VVIQAPPSIVVQLCHGARFLFSPFVGGRG
jgi:hypothetical protein